MRITLATTAGCMTLIALAVACSPAPKAVGLGTPITSTTLKLTCPAGTSTMTMTMTEPTLIIHGNSGGGKSTDLDWNVDPASDATDFTITPKTTTDWPLSDTPPYHAGKNQSFHGKGSGVQKPGIYHYSISATCNGVLITFDPDIVVD